MLSRNFASKLFIPGASKGQPAARDEASYGAEDESEGIILRSASYRTSLTCHGLSQSRAIGTAPNHVPHTAPKAGNAKALSRGVSGL